MLEEPIRTRTAILDKDLPILTMEEWKFLKEMVKILKPLEEVTEMVNGQKFVTGSHVVIFVQGLLSVYFNMTKEKEEFLPLSLSFRFLNTESNNSHLLSSF